MPTSVLNRHNDGKHHSVSVMGVHILVQDAEHRRGLDAVRTLWLVCEQHMLRIVYNVMRGELVQDAVRKLVQVC